MCETNQTKGIYDTSGTTGQGCLTVPSCYEPKDPCENCSLKESCTKRLKPQPTHIWIPIYPTYPWYYVTCSGSGNISTT